MSTHDKGRAVEIESPSGLSADTALRSFSQALNDVGYDKNTIYAHVRNAKHFLHWAMRKGCVITDLNEEWIASFESHLKNCRCEVNRWSNKAMWRTNSLSGARHFIDHLLDAGIVTAASKAIPEEPSLLLAFKQWMRRSRGTADNTLRNYSIPILALLRRLGEDPAMYDARSLREFVLHENRSTGPTVTQRCTTALRNFVRFLIAEGQCSNDFEAAIPKVAHGRQSRLPRYFQPKEVERVIASCNTATAFGKRDRAILLMLSRLGLRAGDIVQCKLGDIDWSGGWIHVSGKSRRATRLPMSQEVGDAIAAYLQDARPNANADTLFVTGRAPFRPFGSHCAVSVIVDKAIRRAGVERPARGAAHLLRHSVASNLLRQGTSMQDISTVLRHRSIETTQIYAKVDVEALRQIAQPWPEVPTC